jgi:hypothetical protein
MSYVRTFSFIIPPDRSHELEPGHNLYLATIDGTQIVAQNSSGFLGGAVWRRLLPTGGIKVVISTEWAGVRELETYTRTPMIQDYEADVQKYHEDVVIEIFEEVA